MRINQYEVGDIFEVGNGKTAIVTIKHDKDNYDRPRMDPIYCLEDNSGEHLGYMNASMLDTYKLLGNIFEK